VAARADARPAGVDWRRNLLLLWVAGFASNLGFTLVTPFLPLFIQRDLHIHDVHALTFWSGVTASIAALGFALAGTAWGVLADRYGRKPMIVRALVSGAAVTALTSVVQDVFELTGARALLGMTAGVQAASSALMADQAPRVRLAWALGMLAGARAVGQAVGPVLGGVLAIFVSLRLVFLTGAAVYVVAALPVALRLVETAPSRASSPVSPLGAIRSAPAGTGATLVVLYVAQALVQFAFTSDQQLLALRILVLEPRGAALATGVTFAGMGLATGLAAMSYARALVFSGYRPLVAVAALAIAIATAVAALTPAVTGLAVSAAAIGLAFGAATPALSSMVGLEAPPAARAAVFGLSTSIVTVATGVGPLSAALAGSTLGLQAALAVGGAAATLAAVVVWSRAREPRIEVQPPGEVG
jgi:MFS transporter, DHA1 family, multidrug resistance protein